MDLQNIVLYPKSSPRLDKLQLRAQKHSCVFYRFDYLVTDAVRILRRRDRTPLQECAVRQLQPLFRLGFVACEAIQPRSIKRKQE